MTQAQESSPARRSALAEFDPFRDLLRPGRFSRLVGDPWAPEAAGASARWAPAMDVAEGKGSYTITLEVPGANKDDISVECHDGVLTVKGEKRDEREEHEEHRHFVERSYGSFSRSVRLPTDAADDINAVYREGVLTVEIQKHEERKPKVVSIGG
jgi:HSP20 family protein